MNRKGFGAFGFILLFIMLLIMYPLVIAPLNTQACTNAIASGATGLDAFLWCNINMLEILTLLIIVAIYYAMGGGSKT